MKIPVILGPTAVGKSRAALEISQDLGYEILSCDSRQIYKYMDIGTAKPSKEEKEKIKHWLIDIIEPDEEYSAFRFMQDAVSVIRKNADIGRKILICGGTAFYFQCLKNGMGSQVPSDYRFRKRYESLAFREGSGALYKKLKECDPGAAASIHENDVQRIIRALQIYYETGVSLSGHKNNAEPPPGMEFFGFVLSLPRERLYGKINERVDRMFAAGLLEEYRFLRKKGYGEKTPGLRCVGYKELLEFEKGDLSLAETKEKIKRNTRKFAKRQMTWLRNRTNFETIDLTDLDKQDLLKKKIMDIQ